MRRALHSFVVYSYSFRETVSQTRKVFLRIPKVIEARNAHEKKCFEQSAYCYVATGINQQTEGYLKKILGLNGAMRPRFSVSSVAPSTDDDDCQFLAQLLLNSRTSRTIYVWNVNEKKRKPGPVAAHVFVLLQQNDGSCEPHHDRQAKRCMIVHQRRRETRYPPIGFFAEHTACRCVRVEGDGSEAEDIIFSRLAAVAMIVTNCKL